MVHDKLLKETDEVRHARHGAEAVLPVRTGLAAEAELPRAVQVVLGPRSAMSRIVVTALEPNRFGVQVTEGQATTNHKVAVSDESGDELN